MTRRIDLNADLGEEVTDDAALLTVVTSANVACGYHAGTPQTMRFVCEEAARLGVAIGAQVSYLDRENFGRRPLDIAPALLEQQVLDQVGVLVDIAEAAGTDVSYVKPHGALYNRVVDDEEQASAVLVGSGSLPVLGLPGGALLRLAVDAGREIRLEGFPDRGYTPEGRLVPRDQPGALIHDPEAIAAHAVALAESVDSVCVHGDSPGAVVAARAVRRALEIEGWDVARW
ncbi:5-oxoprolinase subunit PxpA [Nocardioides cavernaquae]|uniref:LamB/YcsF family protein n=1 Tax=Nocardioides cavernaquae TaxID=2321396 RepID=A0A3A5HC46_9ACTN|nr:5-oxoprolinase subunit PxpA [Nocardioides cavernaquae]RJS47025.1 LamB/YcsF family protein [Nocardioides cavernaquae]